MDPSPSKVGPANRPIPDHSTTIAHQETQAQIPETATAGTQDSRSNSSNEDDTITAFTDDPYSLRSSKWENNTKESFLQTRKVKRVKKFYNRQNALINAYLGSADEEAAEVQETLDNGWKVKLAVYGSTTVNFFLFIIQLYAAISTGSYSLFGTAADAFVSQLHLMYKVHANFISDGSCELYCDVDHFKTCSQTKSNKISCCKYSHL